MIELKKKKHWDPWGGGNDGVPGICEPPRALCFSPEKKKKREKGGKGTMASGRGDCGGGRAQWCVRFWE